MKARRRPYRLLKFPAPAPVDPLLETALAQMEDRLRRLHAVNPRHLPRLADFTEAYVSAIERYRREDEERARQRKDQRS